MHLMCLEISHNCLAERPEASVINVHGFVGKMYYKIIVSVIPTVNVFKSYIYI